MRGLLFRNEFNKYRSTNVRFYLSYDIIIILKSYFCRENVRVCHMRDVKESFHRNSRLS